MKGQPTKQLWGKPQLSARYNRTPRTINEWERNGILPRPDVVINGRGQWYPETVEANERERFSAKPQQGDEVA